MTYAERILAAAAYLGPMAEGCTCALVLGSGLSGFAARADDAVTVPYRDIPGFPISTVPGHEGKLIFGTVSGRRVMIMSGRFHCYEGFEPRETVIPVRVMKRLGIRILILTNAAGGVDTALTPGDMMLITDHINLSGMNPLTGPNEDSIGPRFPDLSRLYDPRLRAVAEETARLLGIPLRKGVYCMMSGPSYETPAEIRMVRMLGAGAVGMSTVPEAIAAGHAGIRCLAISCITNMAAGILNKSISHMEVLEAGRRGEKQFTSLIEGIIGNLAVAEEPVL